MFLQSQQKHYHLGSNSEFTSILSVAINYLHSLSVFMCSMRIIACRHEPFIGSYFTALMLEKRANKTLHIFHIYWSFSNQSINHKNVQLRKIGMLNNLIQGENVLASFDNFFLSLSIDNFSYEVYSSWCVKIIYFMQTVTARPSILPFNLINI